VIIKKNIKANDGQRSLAVASNVILKPIGDRRFHFASVDDPDNVTYLGTRMFERYNFSSVGYSDMNSRQKGDLLRQVTTTDLTSYSYSFKLLIPSVDKDSESNNSSITVSNYSLVPFYNYYAKEYEEVMVGTPLLKAPNCYVSLKNGDIDSDASKRHFGNKKISKKSFKSIISRRKRDFFPTDSFSMNSTKNIIFKKNYNPALGNHLKDFPFGIRLAFDHYHQNSDFAKTFRKLDLFATVMKNYSSMEKVKINMDVSIPGSDPDERQVSYPAIKLLSLIESAAIRDKEEEDQYVVGDSKPHSEYGDNLRTGLLKSFLSSAIGTHSVSYSDYMSGAETYSEALFYKIDKYESDNSDGDIAQTIYIPADNKYASYHDTQVIIGKTYTYSVKVVLVCIGNMYSLNTFDQLPDYADIIVENRPQLLLLEVPLFEDTTIMSASPPLVPFVDFYTKNNSENRINIRMNMPVGIQYDKFTTIEGSDLLQLPMMNTPRGSDLYTFGYQSFINIKYDVYRLTTPPNSYDDFKDRKYLENVEANIRDVLNFVDKVRPNQKYYYMFRAVNQYGMKSNPTPIYCVELLKDSDNSKIEFDVYHFPEQKVSQQNVLMKRLLQLLPAPQHTIFDPDSDMTQTVGTSFNNSLDKLKYGIAEKPIWGRKFKIRVTSNDTGRKIDINVLFNLIKKKANEDLN